MRRGRCVAGDPRFNLARCFRATFRVDQLLGEGYNGLLVSRHLERIADQSLREEGHEVPWNNQNTFLYSMNSVLSSATQNSGVYGIFKPDQWIYIGESGNIKQRLIQHLNRDNECIVRHGPTAFIFELCLSGERVQRQDALILEFLPPCNTTLG